MYRHILMIFHLYYVNALQIFLQMTLLYQLITKTLTKLLQPSLMNDNVLISGVNMIIWQSIFQKLNLCM